MGRIVDPEVEALCRMATETARSRGHDIDGWKPDRDSATTAATATCRRCGRAVHVRAEGALKGAAGTALTEPCGPREEGDSGF
jgi:hypothetical protein